MSDLAPFSRVAAGKWFTKEFGHSERTTALRTASVLAGYNKKQITSHFREQKDFVASQLSVSWLHFRHRFPDTKEQNILPNVNFG